MASCSHRVSPLPFSVTLRTGGMPDGFSSNSGQSPSHGRTGSSAYSTLASPSASRAVREAG